MQTVAVMLHGAGGGAWEYERWQPIFIAAGYGVVANDLLPAVEGLPTTTFDGYCQQVYAWIPPQQRILLIGASMGGLLALKVAEAIQPAALVLVNSVPPAGVAPRRTAKSYPSIVRWTNGPLEETRSALFDSDEATIQWAWPRWRDESGAVLNEIAAGIAVQRPACPTLVVLGEQDTDIPYQTGLALATWANADVLLFHGMSHVGPLLSQRAEEVAQMVVAWCQQR